MQKMCSNAIVGNALNVGTSTSSNDVNKKLWKYENLREKKITQDHRK